MLAIFLVCCLGWFVCCLGWFGDHHGWDVQPGRLRQEREAWEGGVYQGNDSNNNNDKLKL